MSFNELLAKKEQFDQGEIEFNVTEYNELLKQIEVARVEAEEKAVVEQKQTEQLSSIMNAIVEMDLYGGIIIAPEDGQRLYEYEANKQAFNQILYLFVQEQTQAISDYFSGVIAGKNTRIADLQSNINELQDECLTKDKQLSDLSEDYAILQSDLDTANENVRLARNNSDERQAEIERQDKLITKYDIELADKKAAFEREKEALMRTNGELADQIEELKGKLATAQKPAVPVSGNLRNMIDDLKNNSGMKSALEIALERNAPFRGKVEPKRADGAQDEESFRDEVGKVPAVVDPVSQFPGEVGTETAQTNGLRLDQGNTGQSMERAPYVTRAEFERLEIEVNKIKSAVMFK